MSLQILKQIKALSLSEKINLIEYLILDIKRCPALSEQTSQTRAVAADQLAADYESDQDLTSFTSIDADDFYEAR